MVDADIELRIPYVVLILLFLSDDVIVSDSTLDTD